MRSWECFERERAITADAFAANIHQVTATVNASHGSPTVIDARIGNVVTDGGAKPIEVLKNRKRSRFHHQVVMLPEAIFSNDIFQKGALLHMINDISSCVREVVFDRFGSPDVLHVRTRERIHPQSGQVLVKTVSCGVNPIDAKIRAGRNFVCERRRGDPFPWTLGFDAAGIVIEAPEGSAFHAGDRVAGNAGCPIHPCAYAEETLLDEVHCVGVPDDMDLKTAGALPTAALTALSILDLLPPGARRVLVAGGAGGVGHLLVRYLEISGYEVSCTCSKVNLEFMRSLGIEDCHDYHTDLPSDFDGAFDAVVDMPGGAAGIASYRYLRQGGKMITVPTITEKEVIAAAPQNSEAVGVRCIRSAENYARMMKYARMGVMPVISGCMSFDEVARAHELIATGHVRGKLILVP